MQLNALFKHWSFRILAPGTLMREKYEALKQLLQYDIVCHEQMAEFQTLLHENGREDPVRIRHRFTLFSQNVAAMINRLNTIAPAQYDSLKDYHKKFDFYTRYLLAPPAINSAPPFTLALEDISANNAAIGSKAKNLAQLQRDIEAPVPAGFAVTASAYHYFIEYNDLRDAIDALLEQLDVNSGTSLRQTARKLMALISEADVPPEVDTALQRGFDHIFGDTGSAGLVSVRSNAIHEDDSCSFAGQYTTELNVGRDGLTHAYKKVLASKYTPESLYYRVEKGYSDEETAMSVLVQHMVTAAFSGVAYTAAAIEEKDDDRLHLFAVAGLGDLAVGGTMTPERLLLNRRQPPELLERSGPESGMDTGSAACIAAWALAAEKYFKNPQDVEWAVDTHGNVLLLQARPLLISTSSSTPVSSSEPDAHPLLEACTPASPGAAAGPIYYISKVDELDDLPDGAVLVTIDTPPDLVRVLHKVSAVVAQRGSYACHFATVAREFEIPMLISLGDRIDLLSHGETVTVDAGAGCIYPGECTSLLKTPVADIEAKRYRQSLQQAVKFITPLELVDPEGANFTAEGCRSMHDIIRFCHEKALLSMFTTARPGSGRGSLRLEDDMPLDVYLFDVGGGLKPGHEKVKTLRRNTIASAPFLAIWSGLSHPDIQWKQKPFDWDAYDKIELAGGVPPRRDSFAFASYGVIGADYLHFNLRFGYHFTIIDALCSGNSEENHCMLRFAGGGGDYRQRCLRLDFLSTVLQRLDFVVTRKGDLLEARMMKIDRQQMLENLDMLGRLLGATKLMDMVLTDEQIATRWAQEFFEGRYSFSQEG